MSAGGMSEVGWISRGARVLICKEVRSSRGSRVKEKRQVKEGRSKLRKFTIPKRCLDAVSFDNILGLGIQGRASKEKGLRRCWYWHETTTCGEGESQRVEFHKSFWGRESDTMMRGEREVSGSLGGYRGKLLMRRCIVRGSAFARC